MFQIVFGLPAVVVDVCLPWVEKLAISASSLQRGRFIIDLAMLRMHRAHMASLGLVWRFVWGDSSDKKKSEVVQHTVSVLA